MGEIIPLSQLVNMEDPLEVIGEVETIVFMMFPEFDFEVVKRIFADVLALYRGDYPGYRKCNTVYHDMKHTTDALLAFTRLVHGSFIKRKQS